MKRRPVIEHLVVLAICSATLCAAEAVRGKEFMVATANPEATEAALEVLANGGNAADAACAAQFALAVVEPQFSGLGGGGFFLFRRGFDGKVIVLDGREEAPASATPDMFLDGGGKPVRYTPDRITGGLPVGVPGTPAIIGHALTSFGSGKVSLGDVIRPALRLAERGFALSPVLHHEIVAAQDRLSIDPATAAVFLSKDGAPLPIGHTMHRPGLARTFRYLMDRGMTGFYEGELAEAIAEGVQKCKFNPGGLTVDDLAAYELAIREPVRSSYRGLEVLGMGPPSSGATTVFQILNILEGFDLSQHAAGDAALVHLISEASRLAFADRGQYLGDADVVDVPVVGLVSKEFAAIRRAGVTESVTEIPAVHGDPWKFDPGSGEREPPPSGSDTEGDHTSHLVVADGLGNIVCWTTTIEAAFGAALTVPGWGILLNNELTDFDALATFEDGTARPNAAAPGKRPRSSMAPTLLLKDGEPWAAIGSPGGSRIIGIVVNVIVGMVDLGLDVQQAIDMPRTINRNRGDGLTELESPLDRDAGLRRALEARGHRLEPADGGLRIWGAAQGVQWVDGILLGGADGRREGRAAGR